MRAFDWLKDLNTVCHFQTREKSCVGPASNKELKRWIVNRSLHINGKPVDVDTEVTLPLRSVWLFKGKARVTLW